MILSRKWSLPGFWDSHHDCSTIQQNFGEKVRNHGFGIYNVEKDEYEFVDLVNPRPFLTFKITDIEDLEHGTEKLTNY